MVLLNISIVNVPAGLSNPDHLYTDPEDKVNELQKIKWVMGYCGYKKSHFANANANKPPSRNNQVSNASSMKGSVTILYTLWLQKKGEVGVHFKPPFTLHKHLISQRTRLRKRNAVTPFIKTHVRHAPSHIPRKLNAHWVSEVVSINKNSHL